MSRNGSGTYSPPAADFPAVSGTLIESAKYNAVINDIATALTGSIAANGETPITANLPMSNYRHTGVGNAASTTDYLAAGQLITNGLTYAASSAGTDTYAITLTISPSSYTAGMKVYMKADVDNTGACTLNIGGLGAKDILLTDGSTPSNGNIQANGIYEFVYDGTQFLLLNPSYADVFNSTLITGTTVNASTTLQIGGTTYTAVAGVWTAQQNFSTATLTDGASIAWDLSTEQVAKVTLAGNRTLSNPTNMIDGGTYILRVIQDATGSRTLSYGTDYKFSYGTAPVLTTSANAIDILHFISDGTYMYGVANYSFS